MKENIESLMNDDLLQVGKIMEFTGERVIEELTPERIWLDHVARYEYASGYVKGKLVLDIACGTGYGSILIHRSGAKRVIGCDISTEAIDFARAKYITSGIDFKVCDVLNIDYPDNYFDVIVCFETIEHIKNQEKAFTELQRVLKEKGLLIISSPNRTVTSPGRSINDYPTNSFHTIEYTTSEFILALNIYFEILEVYGQREVNKIFLSPIIMKAMSRVLPGFYNPSKGVPHLKKMTRFKEYRYINAVCRKRNKIL